jgi:uncharacterized phage protein gp47/JayE
MFEDKTYESILSNMLSNVSDSVDKRQGSIIYDTLAPIAAELAQTYIDLDDLLNNAFVDKAEDTYLDLKCNEIGLTRIQASKTIQKGVFTGSGGTPFNISIGDRFSVANTSVNFIATEKITDGQYKMECETAGEIGNTVSGQLIPISYVNGLQTANLTEIIILGEDIETDDELRTRYYNKIQNNAQDGNIAQYLEWADEFSGVGRSKVFPLWNGNNTVKVSILDANNNIASSELISEFQLYLDPNSEGLGEGKASIGSIVTVSTATGVSINVSATITLNTGYTIEVAQTQAENAIEVYLRSISYLISSSNHNVSVSLIALGSSILGVDAISSVSNLTLNGVVSDVNISDEQIPQLGTVTFL